MGHHTSAVFPWRMAAPSCVWPDTAAGNCRRLARSVPEVGLYLLELHACLAYGPDDLPQKDYGLRYHAHLPLDLPWALGGQTVFALVDDLLAKTAHLAPWGFVLHPPQKCDALEAFVRAWAGSGRAPTDLLLENIETASPAEVLDLAQHLECGICLDLGHLLAMGHPLPDDMDALAQRVRMLHVYSPFGTEGPPAGRTHLHRTLTCLSPEGKDSLRWMLSHLRPEVVLLEVFAPEPFQESVAVFEALAADFRSGT